MVGVLILTHGDLARELLASAHAIAGQLDNFEALPLSWSDGLDRAHQRVEAALERLDHGDGVLILTDIFGGTPCNVAMAFRAPGRVEVLSGVNLPMVVRLGCLGLDSMPLNEIGCWLRDKGRTSIVCSCDLPRATPPEECEEAAETNAEGTDDR